MEARRTTVKEMKSVVDFEDEPQQQLVGDYRLLLCVRDDGIGLSYFVINIDKDLKPAAPLHINYKNDMYYESDRKTHLSEDNCIIIPGPENFNPLIGDSFCASVGSTLIIGDSFCEDVGPATRPVFSRDIANLLNDNDNDNLLNDNDNTSSWRRIPRSDQVPPRSRFYPAVLVVGDDIYVFGCCSESNTNNSHVGFADLFCSSLSRWESLPDPPPHVFDPCGEVVSVFLYEEKYAVVLLSQPCHNLLLFDLENRKWEVRSSYQNCEFPFYHIDGLLTGSSLLVGQIVYCCAWGTLIAYDTVALDWLRFSLSPKRETKLLIEDFIFKMQDGVLCFVSCFFNKEDDTTEITCIIFQADRQYDKDIVDAHIYLSNISVTPTYVVQGCPRHCSLLKPGKHQSQGKSYGPCQKKFNSFKGSNLNPYAQAFMPTLPTYASMDFTPNNHLQAAASGQY